MENIDLLDSCNDLGGRRSRWQLMEKEFLNVTDLDCGRASPLNGCTLLISAFLLNACLFVCFNFTAVTQQEGQTSTLGSVF